MSTAPSLVRLVECPRDAMQGWLSPIETRVKIDYIQQLLGVGFPILDMGSFVSPKAVPQMADTAAVIAALDLRNSPTELLVIVANERGAKEALLQEKISWLGYPFSVSETFQLRNTGQTLAHSAETATHLQDFCSQSSRKLSVYLSMAFGNPYGDVYAKEFVLEWAYRLNQKGVTHFSLADTVGLATPEQVFDLSSQFLKEFSNSTLSLHLHASPEGWKEKLAAGLAAGCSTFDGAIGGIGGCPFAGSELVGNLNTIQMATWLSAQNIATGIDPDQLKLCELKAREIFS